MTREEAIKALRLERGIEINGNVVRVAEFLQGLDVALTALRPVSRERVEKVWRAIGQKPLFGHHSGKQSRTFWACYMKLEGLKDGKDD